MPEPRLTLKDARAFARTIEVPALTIGAADAVLGIETGDGETASMALLVNGSTIARGEGFRVAEAGRWTWLDMPEREVVETFGSFLSHAIESSDEDAREAWPVLADEAEGWTDALSLYIEVEERARMVCVVDREVRITVFARLAAGERDPDSLEALRRLITEHPDRVEVYDITDAAPY